LQFMACRFAAQFLGGLGAADNASLPGQVNRGSVHRAIEVPPFAVPIPM